MCVFIPSFSSVMFWTYDHEAILCREVVNVNPYATKKGSTQTSKGISLFSTRKSALPSAGSLFARETFSFEFAERGNGRLLGLCASQSRTNSSSSMISSIRHKQSISWTFSNDGMAISAKEMPKNHTDKERFAAASSCIEKGILTLLFPRKRRRSSPSPFISHRVLEGVASRIIKSLIF